MAESFFATVKTEFYYRRVWPTRKRAKIEVGASIGQITPVQSELPYSNQSAELQRAA